MRPALLTAEKGKVVSTKSIEVPVIATVVGGHTGRLDDFKGGTESIIRLHPEFPLETLQGIEEFSHIQVTWFFNFGSPDDVALHARSPRDNPAWPATGTFVHHNHRRPARLATSFPRLLRVEGHDLHVTDLDADDGTLVVDVVAVFEEMLPRGPVRQPSWPSEMLRDYWRDASER
ncbi:SAM-dependent methyltransferase [Streptomyces viridochromogenes]|uniref:TrmO family methyltransferase domain-containing protein n=1 Tax=Streptomyces sp. NBC_01571 TaxID=2975883 RepID=UPI0022599A85|nr:TrmO family methyltransferase [Streptomyces sp. NBC_01571]MCX4578857.1 TrmO family methyltransferase [Streptomyces sp. NBC_01571]